MWLKQKRILSGTKTSTIQPLWPYSLGNDEVRVRSFARALHGEDVVTERSDRQGGELRDLVKQIAAVDTVSRAPHIRAPRSNGAHSNTASCHAFSFFMTSE